MNQERRQVLAAIGLALPIGLARAANSATAAGPPPVLGFRHFEDAVRDAFADNPTGCRRVEVGHADVLLAGAQGCHNDRPFAGFPAGHLRIVRVGSEPGPVRGGVRLYVCTVDVTVTTGGDSRPLDFAALPPAPVLADANPAPSASLVGTGPRRTPADHHA